MTGILGWISLVGFIVLGGWIFGFTPDERSMGFSQKIMYLHLPTIWVTYLSLFVLFVCSIGYLWKRTSGYDRIAKSSAEIGTLFCAMVLVTGSLWGRPTWGSYWEWGDPMLMASLLLFLIFVGYDLLRAFAAPGEQQARLAAVLGIIGFFNMPFIHLSLQWWRTLHQPSTMFKVGIGGAPKPAMPAEFLYPLLTSLLVMTVFYFFLLLYRLRLENKSEALAIQLANR